MDKLIYADVIAKEQTFTALADLGLSLDDLPIDKLLIRLIDLVDSEHLPILADSMSVAGVDGYWLAESDEARRNLIKGAYDLHRYKGTPWAVKEIVRRLGFGNATLIEGFGGKRHNGEITRRDGVYNYGVVDFECEMDDGALWFRGVNCYLIIGRVTDKQVFLTVWEYDECNEVIENFEIQNLDELNVCLKKYALIAQTSTKQDEPNQEQTDTTMIDIHFKLIKDKLAEHQINLDFDKQSQAEKLVVRHIEDKLVEIIKFLQ